MSNCFSSYPPNGFNSTFYFATPTRTGGPAMASPPFPFMSNAGPTMSAHTISEPEAFGFVPTPQPPQPNAYPTRSSFYVNPNNAYPEESSPQYLYYPNVNMNQYLQYLQHQRMQHLNRAQYLHSQSINNLIANLYAQRRAQMSARNSRDFGSRSKEAHGSNQAIITEVVTDDEEEDYAVENKKSVNKKDYVDAISIDEEQNVETLV